MDQTADLTTPQVSVIIVNYNGAVWMQKCLETLGNQTIADQVEIIVSDNNSTDGSDQFARAWLEKCRRGRVIQNGDNIGFCEGNNVGARAARGTYLLFLNSDTWMEPDCLERLCAEVEKFQADAATPIVLNYEDNSFQSSGAAGFDCFGIPNGMKAVAETTEVFAAPGCSLLVRAEMFARIGGFPSELFMYAEETDLSWRIWLAGGRVVVVPAARVHHRGAASANPKGETKILESRTNDTKRFFTNRNGLLLLLKNSQHLLLLLLVPQFILLFLEAVASLFLVRRWSYVRKCYVGAVADCWRMRGHIRTWRARIRVFRRRGDFWMLRFLHWKPNRWSEIERLIRFGVPKIDPH